MGTNLKNVIQFEIFPLSISNIILYFDKFDNDKKVNSKTKFTVIDSEGYKYHLSYNSIQGNIKSGSLPLRFNFIDKTYLLENMNIFLKRNNSVLRVKYIDQSIKRNTQNILCVTNDRDSFEFIVNWRTLFYNVEKYTKDYIIKTKNMMDAKSLTKDEMDHIIIELAESLDRPLYFSDFKGRASKTSISPKIIQNHYGSFEKMLMELQLESHNNYPLLYYKSPDEYISIIKEACENVLKEGRDVVMRSDLLNVDNTIYVYNIQKACSHYNKSLQEVIEEYGCKYQTPGTGYHITFNDGEEAVSKYEYDFSMYLRKLGFKYNQTYFRNVLYSEIDNDYDGKMNCDYKICYGNRILFIELAGMLNHGDVIKYYKNIPIEHSKISEDYRLKLYLKRDMLFKSNFPHYILFPEDMNEETYNGIINLFCGKVFGLSTID